MNYQELSRVAQNWDWAANYKAKIDVENAAILATRSAALAAREGIGVGDFVTDGDKTFRVAHVWPESVQLTDGQYGESFYLSDGGSVSFSGGLDLPVPKAKFTPTDERREGRVWFFSQNQASAHNGYHTEAAFRVWTLN
jgi:hypothetical protein